MALRETNTLSVPPSGPLLTCQAVHGASGAAGTILACRGARASRTGVLSGLLLLLSAGAWVVGAAVPGGESWSRRAAPLVRKQTPPRPDPRHAHALPHAHI